MNIEQLDLIHKRLSMILVLLRDNPRDETNPQMWEQVKEICHTTEFDLESLKSDE